MSTNAFGLIIVGDEILSGRRQDRHFQAFRDLLQQRGFALGWLQILPDDPQLLTERLRATMSEHMPVFSCGGIGATPDDHTRRCAADAAGLAFVRHQGAVAAIEGHFGNQAYPHRIRMADLPEGADLIPNPYNQVPGFSLQGHYFLPGFPELAHPMAQWVLDTYYKEGGIADAEVAVQVLGAKESQIMELIQDLEVRHPDLKLFSLPRIGEEPFVELGFRGGKGIEEALDDLCSSLSEEGFQYRKI